MKKFICLLTLSTISLSFFSYSFKNDSEAGIFSCIINDKPYILKGITAQMRTVTGGYKQLSLSNDLFTSFFFIDPVVKSFELTDKSSNKRAIVRYTNPGNLNLYYPEKGAVILSVLDEKAKVLSGEFEMELTPRYVSGKKIKITQGKLINIPIIYK